MVMDTNLGQNGCAKQNVIGGKRSTSTPSELTQRKNKRPFRGWGIERLVRLRSQEENLRSFNAFTTSGSAAVPNVAVHFRPAAMLVQGIGIRGSSLYCTDPSLIGSGNSNGCQFGNCNTELLSLPNNMKCPNSNGCGVCFKGINGGSSHGLVNAQFHGFYGKNTAVEMMNTGRTGGNSGQVTEVTSVHGDGGGGAMEFTRKTIDGGIRVRKFTGFSRL